MLVGVSLYPLLPDIERLLRPLSITTSVFFEPQTHCNYDICLLASYILPSS